MKLFLLSNSNYGSTETFTEPKNTKKNPMATVYYWPPNTKISIGHFFLNCLKSPLFSCRWRDMYVRTGQRKKRCACDVQSQTMRCPTAQCLLRQRLHIFINISLVGLGQIIETVIHCLISSLCIVFRQNLIILYFNYLLLLILDLPSKLPSTFELFLSIIFFSF